MILEPPPPTLPQLKGMPPLFIVAIVSLYQRIVITVLGAAVVSVKTRISVEVQGAPEKDVDDRSTATKRAAVSLLVDTDTIHVRSTTWTSSDFQCRVGMGLTMCISTTGELAFVGIGETDCRLRQRWKGGGCQYPFPG